MSAAHCSLPCWKVADVVGDAMGDERSRRRGCEFDGQLTFHERLARQPEHGTWPDAKSLDLVWHFLVPSSAAFNASGGRCVEPVRIHSVRVFQPLRLWTFRQNAFHLIQSRLRDLAVRQVHTNESCGKPVQWLETERRDDPARHVCQRQHPYDDGQGCSPGRMDPTG